ncbi:MAG: hypothetical protein IPG99_15950 [Ignavibacteria bacterium]|nr:hypothetical protein [Ignavibacteria bacterium]
MIHPSQIRYFSGDMNQDGNINLTDVISVTIMHLYFQQVIRHGRQEDNSTDLTDILIANGNSIKCMSVIRP